MIEEWFFAVPPVTRVYMLIATVLTVLCSIEVLSPLSLILNTHAIRTHLELWRFVSTFFFFETFSLNFLLHMHFVYMYFHRLETEFFRGKSVDFLYMLLLGGIGLLFIAPFVGANSALLLSYPLVFMVLYVWSKFNPDVPLSFLGIFNFRAPFLPWVLLTFSFLVSGGQIRSVIVDLMGIVVGHLYYYFKHVVPALTGTDLLKTPAWLLFVASMLGRVLPSDELPNVLPLPEDEQR